jgi:phosphopentomutase
LASPPARADALRRGRARRIFLLVLDGVGVGELPDAPDFGDAGSHTLLGVARSARLEVPNLRRLGLGNVAPEALPPVSAPEAAWGKLQERSAGKDSTSGHWELAGLVLRKPFPTYPSGFPPEVIGAFEAAIGRKVIGNRPASGTAIIEELGEEHMRTGKPIVYTSADSVFQVACHKEVVPLEELYRICQVAREILVDKHAVCRVIARPFEGRPGSFRRTPERRDFSLPPPGPTLLDLCSSAGLTVATAGKTDEIFAGRGVSIALHRGENAATMAALEELAGSVERGLVIGTLVDFDTKYGHRNDPQGFARALEEFDLWLGRFLGFLGPGDVVMITADHGCDPTTPSTDHSREHVPVLVWGEKVARVPLGVRRSMADVGRTAALLLGLDPNGIEGEDFLELLFPG